MLGNEYKNFVFGDLYWK